MTPDNPDVTDCTKTPPERLVQGVVGLRFFAKVGNRGMWEWIVDSEPAKALDGTGKLFVWANALRQVKGGSYNRNPGRQVFYLPLPTQPNSEVSERGPLAQD